MLKIEAVTLEEAYKKAASSLRCSVTELRIEVVQIPSKGFLGLFKKTAIIVAVKEIKEETRKKSDVTRDTKKREVLEEKTIQKSQQRPKETTPQRAKETTQAKPKKQSKKEPSPSKNKVQKKEHILNNTIMPISFVSTQDDEDEYGDVSNYLADYEDETDFCEETQGKGICEIVDQVKEDINTLFDMTCFKIESIDVSVHNEDTLLVEFKGEDAALLIGKEGYRYKALSYMIFNWLNTKYQVQLRLEIAEFLINQEDAIKKYLVGICESIDRDGRAQTKILDGVLIQIALNELRERYPNKYVAMRSTRDGLKYIIINDYHNS
ncbi:MAG: hypothetical protein COB42_01840 [Sulfurimonas sp.]|nr:MAG: hypothetical protein COB42_01840 [Sulfurimonas sp.]